MNNSDRTGDEAIMASWHTYMADEPDFVGHWLGLLRERLGITTVEQQDEFGADAPAFRRLQSLPLPRRQAFARDAHRIAEHCHLKNPMAFVQAMILARSLERAADHVPVQEFYQAAFDEEELE